MTTQTTDKPTLIFSSYGVSFYECPIEGDATSLLVKGTDGEFYYTSLYDAPCSREEAQQEYVEATRYLLQQWEA